MSSFQNFLCPDRGCFQGRLAGVILCIMLVLVPANGVRSSINIDLLLVLALDVSGSVDEHEFELQTKGLADAFRHPSVLHAIRRGKTKRVAVTVVQWAGHKQQHVALPWVVISDSSSLASFANSLDQMRRSYPDGATDIAGVIEVSTKLLVSAPFAAERRTIDISGDGEHNIGDSPRSLCDAAVSVGITVNGLAILNSSNNLVDYYRTNVIGGPGSFVISAINYDDFRRAILLKLLREFDVRLT
ncbi:MAG TPA: DUF1194 domain-containing protein [Hyphomicrobiaceae bacterium]|nr:DUF1194 domain-containing protein [Hyphomicrobiaceae bacterium]